MNFIWNLFHWIFVFSNLLDNLSCAILLSPFYILFSSFALMEEFYSENYPSKLIFIWWYIICTFSLESFMKNVVYYFELWILLSVHFRSRDLNLYSFFSQKIEERVIQQLGVPRTESKCWRCQFHFPTSSLNYGTLFPCCWSALSIF